jgi:outer membrane protein OmpA-like peptidoglycan-associated protein
MWILLFKGLLLITVFFSCLQTQAQQASEPATLVMADMGAYSIIERSNLRRYNNGEYIGHVLRDVRASIIPKPADKTNSASNGTLLYQGSFFVLGDTLRETQKSAQLDAVIPVSFQLRGNGTIIIENDQGFPTMRGFPTLPTQKVIPGFKWSAPGNRAVDPDNIGQPVIVPFTANYEYRGTELYKNIPVHRIYATYGSQYQNRSEGPNFARVQGSHKVDILIRVEDGLPLFMRDTLDETYIWADGSTVRFQGFTLTFGDGIVPMDKGAILSSLENTLGIEPEPTALAPDPTPPPPVSIAGVPEKGLTEKDDQATTPPLEKPAINTAGLQNSAIDLVPVPEGIRLTIKDIRFEPDSAKFLDTERPRLDLIAEALKQIPDRSFLVEGHTAATGRPLGEMELSIERAKHMVDELVMRGISADRFMYKGWGGTKPLASNTTTTGRARNRRVEITILE